MKKTFITLSVLFLFAIQLSAQKYITRNGHIWFFSKAPLENIEAHNYQASSVMDLETGDMESDKYPKSTFKGKILNIEELDLSKDGIHEVEVEGDLSIKDATNHIKVKGTLEKKGDKIIAKSKFPVRLADYNIHIPAMVKDNIAEVVDVMVDVEYEPYKK